MPVYPGAQISPPEARADLRAIDRETAMQILHCVDRYLANRAVDVKKLKPRHPFDSDPDDPRAFQEGDSAASRSPVIRHERKLWSTFKQESRSGSILPKRWHFHNSPTNLGECAYFSTTRLPVSYRFAMLYAIIYLLPSKLSS
jgi:hypothetical protein